MEDYTLVGHFNLLRIVLKYKPNEIEFDTLQFLFKDLLEKCLMNVNYEPLDNDIEDCTDLAPHEKSVISKCLTRESSSSCFQLLIDILNRAM